MRMREELKKSTDCFSQGLIKQYSGETQIGSYFCK